MFFLYRIIQSMFQEPVPRLLESKFRNIRFTEPFTGVKVDDSSIRWNRERWEMRAEKGIQLEGG